MVGTTAEARHPLGRKTPFASAKAITDIELVRIDEDLLDIMLTWDQLAADDRTGARATESGVPSMANWAILSGVFSINNLKSGAFAQLPTAHINEMLKRFQRVGVKRGQVVIREGEAGDYYYVVESGRCLVERNVGGVSMKLAELKGGDPFGEEALVANAKRNATVTMLAEGSLFRLAKEDFNELLKKPLLQSVTMDAGAGEDRRRRAVDRHALPVRVPVRQAARRDEHPALGGAERGEGARPHPGVRPLLPERPAQLRGGVPARAARLQGVRPRRRPAGRGRGHGLTGLRVARLRPGSCIRGAGWRARVRRRGCDTIFGARCFA